MKRNKKIALFATGLMAVSIMSCTKKFESINTNPNSPTDAPATNVLANAIQNVGANIYDVWANMNEPETYAGHLAKIQYIDEARYSFRTGTVENDWTYDYRILHDLQGVIDNGSATPNMKAAALTLQSLVLQIVTDTWRDVPWTQAIKGSGGFIAPAYDTQEALYDTLTAHLQMAADLFKSGGTDDLGDGDLLYNGKVEKWQKFCNSLRLRVAIRMANAAPEKAKPIIESIFANPTDYPVFAGNDDNAFIVWPGSDPYFEPWYDDYQGRDDHAVSDVLINQLKSTSDPRLEVYAQPAATDGAYTGAPIGPAGSLPNIGRFSRIGARFRENPSGFTPLQRWSEVLFIEAEAAAKGWTVPMGAAAAYDAAVSASMTENGLTTGDAQAFLTLNPYKTEADIHMQKWVALFKDGHEAWAEERRTDIPLLPAAPGSAYTGHTRPPFRYPYTTKENTLNGANLAPFLAKVKDNFWGQQMFWDKRTNVQ
ncbi:SusD/RagB family nutrient-binding outer membrane lipoprotein [Chitinophaga parva]|uniref:SusD/RagB family nutrient-binding outer membrane lipoprotein n=2 Tax=Chitinophaga parva TaxID=2169414 RepID=A0A2T7BNW3_9BACT|nr:SusD/RagB family nutrient-binding outer membrane lipoprotein [Chitinophaga parva]